MGDRLKELREKSLKRKQLLAQALGVSSPEVLKTVLKSKDEQEDKEKQPSTSNLGDAPAPKKKAESLLDDPREPSDGQKKEPKELDDGEKDDFDNEEMYQDSSTFLKGLQSANPHNDYCQNFVDTGERPQNFIRDVGLANRFEEYPKLRELIRLKDELISKTNSPPMYYHCDLHNFDLRELRCKFDVILIEPPLEEYQRAKGVVYDTYWDWDDIERLDIPAIAAQRSFIWIWCGNADGLERGRQCLKRWGFRRCEDICWIKTNIKNPGHNKNLEPNSILQRTKEHCLMGIKGTVKRSTDGDFIHANVDIDLIIEEEPPYGCKDKPVEIFHIIEHFCLGRRRIHLFGRDSTIRPGWLSIGTEVTSSNFDPEVYATLFQDEESLVTGCSEEIERLRPKSPQPKNKNSSDRGGKPGRGGPNRGRGSQRGDHSGRNMRGQRGRGSMQRGMGRGGFKPRNVR